jgi:hypothetical protein
MAGVCPEFFSPSQTPLKNFCENSRAWPEGFLFSALFLDFSQLPGKLSAS